MNEIEAIKELQDSIDLPFGYVVSEEVTKMAVSALEKQIAKRPIMRRYFEDSEEEYLCCPTCGEILTDRIPFDNKTFYFHCMNCGQKFDWSSDE